MIYALFGLVSRCVCFCRARQKRTSTRAVKRIRDGFRRLKRDEKNSRRKRVGRDDPLAVTNARSADVF